MECLAHQEEIPIDRSGVSLSFPFAFSLVLLGAQPSSVFNVLIYTRIERIYIGCLFRQRKYCCLRTARLSYRLQITLFLCNQQINRAVKSGKGKCKRVLIRLDVKLHFSNRYYFCRRHYNVVLN